MYLLYSGYLKDTLAPGCTGDDDSVSTSSDCRDDKDGLRLTMLLITLWLFWCSAFFGLAWLSSASSVRKIKQLKYENLQSQI